MYVQRCSLNDDNRGGGGDDDDGGGGSSSNNNNHSNPGPIRFLNAIEYTFGEGLLPLFEGGNVFNCGLPPSPIPALPPYVVRTPHICGRRTTDDTITRNMRCKYERVLLQRAQQ